MALLAGWGEAAGMFSLPAERARSECARSMRAVEGSLGHSPQRGVEIIGRLLLDARSKGHTSFLAERVLRGLKGNLQRDGNEAWLVSRARATRGRGLPRAG